MFYVTHLDGSVFHHKLTVQTDVFNNVINMRENVVTQNTVKANTPQYFIIVVSIT